MTTRRHIILLVLPIFILLSLMGGALMAWVQLSAAQRDFKAEVRTLAVAVRVGIETDSVQSLVNPSAARKPRLSIVFERILHWGQVRGIQVVSDNHGIVFDSAFEQPSPWFELPATEPDSEGIAWHPLDATMSGEPVQHVTVTLPVPGWRFNLAVDATDYFAHRETVWRTVVWFVAACWVVGLAASLILAHFVAAQFRRLTAHAEQIGEDHFDLRKSHSRIQEIADVNDILAVMHSVFRETVERSRRTLENSAPPPTDHLANQVFRDDQDALEIWSENTVRGAIIRVGKPLTVTGHMLVGPDQGFAFIGVMPDDTLLETALRARAAREALIQILRNDSPDSAVTKVVQLFDLPELEVIRWRDGRWQKSRHGTRVAPSPATAGAWVPGQPIMLTCLGPTDIENLNLFQNACSDLGFERLISDLPVVLRGSPPGLVMILQSDDLNHG